MFERYLATFLWSITPVVELRGSIPLGVLHYKLGLTETVLLSVAGGMLVTAVLLALLPPLIRLLRKVKIFETIIHKVLEKTRSRHSKRILLLGEIALVVIVAIPLPGSGAFTGTLLAYLFGIPYRKAFFLISSGIFFSAIIVSALLVFGSGIAKLFFLG